MTTKEAISVIVTYYTLPPQIDYTLPYKLKSIEAEKFLNALPQKEYDNANTKIRKQCESYYAPGGAGEYDKLY